MRGFVNTASKALLVLGFTLFLARNAPWSWLRIRKHRQSFPVLTPYYNGPDHYFFNEISGAVQWEDPGGAPYEDEKGVPYWLDEEGKKIQSVPNTTSYVWVWQYSKDFDRPYYWNQEAKSSVWERPVDMAWRKVKVKPK